MANENFLKPTQWKYLKEILHTSPSQRDANGTWLITPGVKDPTHVFVFIQQTRKQNDYRYNPYIFDTFDIDGDNSARLDTCRLKGQINPNFDNSALSVKTRLDTKRNHYKAKLDRNFPS